VINPTRPATEQSGVNIGPSGRDLHSDDDRRTPAPTADELEAIDEALEEQIASGASPTAVAAKLTALRPPDQATVVSQLDPEVCATLLASMNSSKVAEFIEHIDAEAAVTFSTLVPRQKLAEVLDLTEPDVAADVLSGMGWDDASHILMRMTERQSIRNLLLYRDDGAGGL
jgi:flagellar motility protein MotE (MotC chaperone)